MSEHHQQAGILNRPPKHVLVVALNFTESQQPSGVRGSLGNLQGVLDRELHSDINGFDANTDATSTTVDTGELGPADGFNRNYLTVTLGISKRGFDALGITSGDRPQDLEEVPWADLGDSPVLTDSGHLVLQVSSDDLFVVEHVVRRIEHELSADFTFAWSLLGAQRFTSRAARVALHEARAVNGFLDGLSNLDPAHKTEDHGLVFVDPTQVDSYPKTPPAGQQAAGSYGPNNQPIFPVGLRNPPAFEPAWTEGGSYMFVRASEFGTGPWDQSSIHGQELEVGRFKFSGAPLSQPNDVANQSADPNFAADPDGATTPFTAHVRKANPRLSSEDQQRRIFRRGYPLVSSTLGGGGGLRLGLVFIAYGRSLSTQVEFMTRAWLRNKDFPRPEAGVDALLQRETAVLAGGYYFVPAVESLYHPTSWIIPPEVSSSDSEGSASEDVAG